MLTPETQHEKFHLLHEQYNKCYCLLNRADWRQSSCVDADFESPYGQSPSGLLRLVYFVSTCYYCDMPTLFGVMYHSREFQGIHLLVQAINYCDKTISEQMHMQGNIDPATLRRIRNEIRAVWLRYHPEPI